MQDCIKDLKSRYCSKPRRNSYTKKKTVPEINLQQMNLTIVEVLREESISDLED